MAPNHLADETSPYLRLHAHNPVDWYPWGDAALARARAEGKPIFLSIGYSSCHWCHVMERESFASEAIADLLNRHFVSIKVDREERPDLDAIYMTATQLLTGQGGWPNSLFLTPGLEPFYAGTYFPPTDGAGLPGFPRLLAGLAAAWAERREELERRARDVAEVIRRQLGGVDAAGRELPGVEPAQRVLAALERSFDPVWGGFGSAPKFPMAANLLLLLELAPEQERAAELLRVTLDRMARGGLFDQLGGGFHRYATDREWRVPHFEKMLYDNGLLLEVYARWASASGDPEAARIARATAVFLLGEMALPDGGFRSALDADTEGEEGAYYVWSREELREILGEEDFHFAAPLLGFDGPSSFAGGRHVLCLPEPIRAAAESRQMTPEALLEALAPIRARLLEARRRRSAPPSDDKLLADWNGTAVSGLAVAGGLLGEADWLASARTTADFLLATLRPEGGPLHHVRTRGRVTVPALLADYAAIVRGLLGLFGADRAPRWLEAAEALTLEQEERLGDPQGGFFTAAASPDLLARGKDLADGALPAANGVAALNLVDLARWTGRRRWRVRAEAAVRDASRLLEARPEAAPTLAVAARRLALAV